MHKTYEYISVFKYAKNSGAAGAKLLKMVFFLVSFNTFADVYNCGWGSCAF